MPLLACPRCKGTGIGLDQVFEHHGISEPGEVHVDDDGAITLPSLVRWEPFERKRVDAECSACGHTWRPRR